METTTITSPARPLPVQNGNKLGRYARQTLLIAIYAYYVGLVGYWGLRVLLDGRFWLVAFLDNFAAYSPLPLLLTLPLAFAVGRRPIRLVTVLLTLIAAVGLAQHWLPGDLSRGGAVDAQAATLTVVTFNVWGDNPRTADVIDWLRETNADVVLLQEIPPQWAGDGIPELRDLYPHQVSQPADFHYWGHAILSRHPIVLSDRYTLENTGINAHEFAHIDVNGQTVAVYNVHLWMPLGERQRVPVENDVSPYAHMLSRYDERGRNGQIAALVALLADETLPFIVGGDFNMSATSTQYDALAAVMRDSHREAGWGPGPTWPQNRFAGLPGWVPPVLRIDYIWHSDAFTTVAVERGPSLGSDHLPVVATLHFAK